jgi:voltage-gated potassium channel
VNRLPQRIYYAIAAVLVLIIVATGGYMLIDHMTLLEALYMTIITISTVGYEEVKPLDDAGRIFTIFVIMTGVGTAFYVFGAVTEAVVGGQLRDFVGRNSMHHKIAQLHNHVILCGYGRFGRVVAEELRRNDRRAVVIENDPAKEPELMRAGELFVLGSALDEEVLTQAGIERAAFIVVATASDPDNVYISLSARSRNPRIRIYARAESEIGLKHLRLAGVDGPISSYQWSAMRIANAITRPSVVDFLGLILPGRGNEEIDIEEVTIPPQSPLCGQRIGDIEGAHERLRIVALKRGNEAIALVPAPTTVVAAGDLLIAIGARASLTDSRRHLTAQPPLDIDPRPQRLELRRARRGRRRYRRRYHQLKPGRRLDRLERHPRMQRAQAHPPRFLRKIHDAQRRHAEPRPPAGKTQFPARIRAAAPPTERAHIVAAFDQHARRMIVQHDIVAAHMSAERRRAD